VSAQGTFPRWWRLAAALWLAVWMPSYAAWWGWRNFFALCDVAAALTCVGIWRGSALLLSSQATAAVIPAALWLTDVVSRLATGHHLFGGTEYMWDGRVPLAVRLLSLFHLLLPAVLVAALRRTGYDRRGLGLQVGLTAILLLISRLVGQTKNLNYAFVDPLLHRAWGPWPLHLASVLIGTTLLVYLPAHLVLGRTLRAAAQARP
jgi:hypothetical protein